MWNLPALAFQLITYLCNSSLCSLTYDMACSLNLSMLCCRARRALRQKDAARMISLHVRSSIHKAAGFHPVFGHSTIPTTSHSCQIPPPDSLSKPLTHLSQCPLIYQCSEGVKPVPSAVAVNWFVVAMRFLDDVRSVDQTPVFLEMRWWQACLLRLLPGQSRVSLRTPRDQTRLCRPAGTPRQA